MSSRAAAAAGRDQASARADRDVLLADAAALIRIRSANPPGRERPVAEWVAARLAGIADRVSVDVLAPDRANVVATFDFGPGPSFLLCSHSDVVPVQDVGQWQPAIRDGRLIGRGASDAKGAIAAMIGACERLAARRGDLRGTLLFACVADEESNAEGARALASSGLHADAAIIGEPTDNVAVFGSRGTVRLGVHFRGRAAHASSPSRGVNAIYAAARFILAIEALDAELNARGSEGSCAATIVDGGSKSNIVPEACSVHVDRRLGPHEAREAALHDIESCLTRVALEVPGVSYEWSPAGIWIDPFDLGAGSAFATKLLSTLDQRAPGPTFRAVSDAPHLIAVGIPTAILGPGSLDVAHSDREYVEIQALEVAVDLYERIAFAFLGRAEPADTGARSTVA